MAGKNVFNKGKKRVKRRKAKTTDGRQNQRLKKLENLILPSIELKSRDIIASLAPISSSGYANQPLFQLEQGDDHNQRVGDKVTLKSMQVSLTVARQDC